MEQLLTTNIAVNLYWFGRHMERVEVTLVDILELFDVVIDTDKEAGRRYFDRLGVALEYEDASQFLDNAIFGDHPGNLADIMRNARENAIICRSQIAADAFGETIKLYQIFDHASKSAVYVDYRFVDEALSLLNEIRGILSRGLVRRKSDHFIRLGRLVEKVDLYLRHGQDGEESAKYLNNILTTAQEINPEIGLAISVEDEEANLDAINTLIDRLVVE